MSQFTSGPWRVDRSCGGLAIESDRGNIGLVNLARASKADARLIAQAPDLYALAVRYASECPMCEGDGIRVIGIEDCVPCERCASIRAVLAKADGNE